MPIKTIKTWLLEDMEARGLFPQESEAVFNSTVRDGARGMADSWDMDHNLFSYQVKLTLRLFTNHEVIVWMDANKPKHWAREHFET